MQSLIRVVPRRLFRLTSTSSTIASANNDYTAAVENQVYEYLMKNPDVSWSEFQKKDFPQIVQSCSVLRRSPAIHSAKDEAFMKRNFASVVITSLAKHDQARLLHDFVRQYGMNKLSVLQISLYMRYCNCPEGILDAWRFLVEKNGTLFDTLSTTNIVEGLCKTDQWRNAEILIKNLSEVSKPSSTSFVPLIRKLSEEGLHDEAFNWLDRVYSEYTSRASLECEPVFSSMKNAERFFKFAADRYLQFDIELFSNSALRSLFKVTLTRIKFPSRCRVCHNDLRSAEKLTMEELQILREAVRMRLINKQENIFLTTTPEELNNFEKFMRECGPFDVVIDGLNVGYRISACAVAKEAIRLATIENKRVLIMGRRHMLRWPGMKMLPLNVAVYTMTNITKDDPFMFLACLYSHTDCMLVSSDHFRDHRADLNPMSRILSMSGEDAAAGLNHERLFRRWISTHQQQVGRSPLQHDVVAQKDPGGWHLPVQSTTERPYGSPYHEQWACLRYVTT